MPSTVKERMVDWLPEDFGFLWLAQFYLALFIGRYIAVAVHEVGHALAGRWRGLRFSFMTVGRIWISNVDGHLRVRKNPGLMVRGGLCASFPGDKEPTQSDLRWFILCGPLASAVLAAAAFGLLYATSERYMRQMTSMRVAVLSDEQSYPEALSLLEQVPALQQNTLVPISDYDTSLTNELVAMATTAQAHRPTADAAVD